MVRFLLSKPCANYSLAFIIIILLSGSYFVYRAPSIVFPYLVPVIIEDHLIAYWFGAVSSIF